ncbi:MAG: monovalent cation/H+ antiporter subunit D family protein [Verrucomicrobiota bacterium]|nr:monovalent cation/H+ antiporter subunit D family protein [Verrucomicrobiota bacterium]
MAALLIALLGRWPNLREACIFAAAVIKLCLLLSLAPAVLDGKRIGFEMMELIPNVSLAFRVDALGLMFALVSVSLWIPTTIFSMGFLRPLKRHAQTRFFFFFAIAISSAVGVAFSANLLTLFIFYEILSLSTYPLVTHHQDDDAIKGGRKYLTYLLGTSVALALPAMIIVYQKTGSLDFTNGGVFPEGVSPTMLTLLLVMFLFGFAKAGLMPFHAWLPGAMVAPAPVSALLHAVAVVKVGVFSILRVLTGIFGVERLANTASLGTIVCVLAAITLIVASLIALTQDNIKSRLAYSTVGQLSYIILGVGLATKAGIAGAALHIPMHAFGKITLFLCAGAIYQACGAKCISEIHGIGHKFPLTMTAFFIGSLCVIGLPPTGGFISKWYLLTGSLDSAQQWAFGIFLSSSLLNAAYFLPITYKAFFAKPSDPSWLEKAKEPPSMTVVPLFITAAGCLLLFFFSDYLFQLAINFAEQYASNE